jgi:hypothetical protein
LPRDDEKQGEKLTANRLPCARYTALYFALSKLTNLIKKLALGFFYLIVSLETKFGRFTGRNMPYRSTISFTPFVVDLTQIAEFLIVNSAMT